MFEAGFGERSSYGNCLCVDEGMAKSLCHCLRCSSVTNWLKIKEYWIFELQFLLVYSYLYAAIQWHRVTPERPKISRVVSRQGIRLCCNAADICISLFLNEL